MKIISVTSDLTHDLRRRVLRADDPQAMVQWTDDDADTTTHFAAVADDGSTIVGVSTWIEADGRVQLRGMATEPLRVGHGIGTALLDAGIEHARDHGATSVWANARVTALGFYGNYGFVISGPVFVTEATGLRHRLATYDLT